MRFIRWVSTVGLWRTGKKYQMPLHIEKKLAGRVQAMHWVLHLICEWVRDVGQ